VRRIAPVTIVSVCVTALLVWYVIYTQGVVRELRREASRVGLMYARVYDGLNDPGPDAANTALLDLSRHIRESGVPLIITDAKGNPSAAANLFLAGWANSASLGAAGFVAVLLVWRFVDRRPVRQLGLARAAAARSRRREGTAGAAGRHSTRPDRLSTPPRFRPPPS